ncbi:hypothetical protein THIOM_000857 [Candidatus Thiomargarita nelsonii]|uniref:DUF3179 domain-containing protein n=1 Tax=Candidatus Thiomargarita nelsonii TaxID=1003181 RepID=A0A176S5M7_9GAMM|nr:hypothetical protein THIOM_000857 [Candidatus Thiomargarita nelsonii]
MVTFCPGCWSGAAFDSIIQGERYTFRLAGHYNGGLLIADIETGSLWSPFTGKALHGPLKGTTLARLPLYLTTWSEWLNEHPTSLVLYASMIYKQRTYYTRIKKVLLNLLRSLRVVRGKMLYKSLLQQIDERLPANQLVLGVEINGIAKAYPLSALDKTKSVINDTLGNHKIVIFHKPETWTAIAFSRQLGNEVLVFDRTEDGKIIDRNTLSYWN